MAGLLSVKVANYADRFVSRINRLRFNTKFSTKETKSAILMFHDVSDSGIPYSVTELEFNQIINSVLLCGYKFCSLDDLLTHKYTHDHIVMTFDDAYSTVYTNALPVLEKYHIPFTLFISTSLIDRGPYLKLNEIIALSENELCSFGSHLHNHIMTRNLSAEEIRNELQTSFEILSNLVRLTKRYVALPYGSLTACSAEDCRLIRLENVDGILLTTQKKISCAELFYPYSLPRIDASALVQRGKV